MYSFEKIEKNETVCGTCKHFMQHYTRYMSSEEPQERYCLTIFGHCCRNLDKIKSKKSEQRRCRHWEDNRCDILTDEEKVFLYLFRQHPELEAEVMRALKEPTDNKAPGTL